MTFPHLSQTLAKTIPNSSDTHPTLSQHHSKKHHTPEVFAVSTANDNLDNPPDPAEISRFSGTGPSKELAAEARINAHMVPEVVERGREEHLAEDLQLHGGCAACRVVLFTAKTSMFEPTGVVRSTSATLPGSLSTHLSTRKQIQVQLYEIFVCVQRVSVDV